MISVIRFKKRALVNNFSFTIALLLTSFVWFVPYSIRERVRDAVAFHFSFPSCIYFSNPLGRSSRKHFSRKCDGSKKHTKRLSSWREIETATVRWRRRSENEGTYCSLSQRLVSFVSSRADRDCPALEDIVCTIASILYLSLCDENIPAFFYSQYTICRYSYWSFRVLSHYISIHDTLLKFFYNTICGRGEDFHLFMSDFFKSILVAGRPRQVALRCSIMSGQAGFRPEWDVNVNGKWRREEQKRILHW